LVGVCEPHNSISPVELAPHLLVSLHKVIKLSSKVTILALNHLSVLLKSLSLSQKIKVSISKLRVLEFLLVVLFSHHDTLVLGSSESDLVVSDLTRDISVSSLVVIDFFPGFVCFPHSSVNLTSQSPKVPSSSMVTPLASS
jgi:hypothetical protein